MKMTAFDREKLKNVLKEKIIRAYEIRKNNQKDLYRNTLDVFAAVLDAKIQQLDISDWIEKFERPRQAQKTFENLLGEIHPAVIGTLDDWEDLKTGKVIDVLNKKDKIVAEFKNKANTTNSDSALGAYDALEKFVNSPDQYEGYMVQVLPKNGDVYNEPFSPSDKKTKKKRPLNTRLRKIDGKSFYALATGEDDALEQFYNEYPSIIDEILTEEYKNYSSTNLGDMRQEIFEKIFPKDEN